MTRILVREPLSPEEVAQLEGEFPHCQLIPVACGEKVPNDVWRLVEVVYGAGVTPAELSMAPQLRWIHSPHPHLEQLKAQDLRHHRRDILITNTRGQNVAQMGEFVLATTLAFTKKLFHFKEANTEPSTPVGTLRGATFLQIGLGMVGTETARLAQLMGMRVWGVRLRRSFHPHCDAVYTSKELHSLLPAADVVSLCLPRCSDKEPWFGANECALLKEGAIFISVGGGGAIDEGALEKIARSGRLRGALLDVVGESCLRGCPNVVITPGVATHPKSSVDHAFQTFRYNLRHFTFGNYVDMRNIVEIIPPSYSATK